MNIMSALDKRVAALATTRWAPPGSRWANDKGNRFLWFVTSMLLVDVWPRKFL